MAHIKIEWLTDYSDCETCGGNYADGARVTIDGAVALDLEPVAHCYGGQHYGERDVFKRVLEHLGHTVEVE
jgi:hypothetical protein